MSAPSVAMDPDPGVTQPGAHASQAPGAGDVTYPHEPVFSLAKYER